MHWAADMLCSQHTGYDIHTQNRPGRGRGYAPVHMYKHTRDKHTRDKYRPVGGVLAARPFPARPGARPGPPLPTLSRARLQKAPAQSVARWPRLEAESGACGAAVRPPCALAVAAAPPARAAGGGRSGAAVAVTGIVRSDLRGRTSAYERVQWADTHARAAEFEACKQPAHLLTPKRLRPR